MTEYIFPVSSEEEEIFIDGELLGNDSEFLKRAFAMKLMEQFVPCDYRDEKMFEITQGRAQRARKDNAFFSTCGELVMFLLERMGYRGKILNRTLTTEKTPSGPIKARKYRYGANIARIFGTSKKEGVWVPFTKGMTPNLGDCIFISNGPPRTEHVFVFKESFIKDGQLYWRSWDAGQGGRITQSAKVCERKVRGRKVGSRTCYGWINIDRLELVAPAILGMSEG